jgi:hypothetical protein
VKAKRRHQGHATQAQARRYEQRQLGLARQTFDGGCGVSRSDNEARLWRESCRDARAATRKQKAAIREAWRAWPGPATVLCFRYIVDLHTGVINLHREAVPMMTRTGADHEHRLGPRAIHTR